MELVGLQALLFGRRVTITAPEWVASWPGRSRAFSQSTHPRSAACHHCPNLKKWRGGFAAIMRL